MQGQLRIHYPTSILLALLLCTVFWSCKKPKPAPPPPPQVEVVPVVQKDIPLQHEWVGTLDGNVNAVIRAQVSGYLTRQNYKEGEQVQKGQVLFEIDPRPFEASLKQAQGTLSQAEAQYENAKANLARVQPLAEQRALSKRELDEANAALRTTRAQMAAARAAVENARLNLGFTKIKSPITGIAGIAQAQVGNLVGPAQTGALTTVSAIDPIKVYFSVPEQDYIEYIRQRSSSSGSEDLLQPDQFEIVLILTDGTVYPRKGKFFAIDRQVDPRTGTLLVETTFPNPELELRPGQFGRVRVTVGTKRGALLVPQRAVNELQGRFQTAVVGPDNKIEIRNVRPGSRLGELWEIDEGLKPGERVVAEGVQKVKQDMAVSPKPYVAQQPDVGKTEGQAAGGTGKTEDGRMGK